METGFITDENKRITISYYEMGMFAESICKNYVEENENNGIRFEEFSKNYHHFKPYFDFLLFELRYKMVNPLLRQNSTWYVEEGILYLKTSTQSIKYHYLPVNDVFFKKQYISPENLQDCVVDFDGVSYNVPRELGLFHEEMDELILNQSLIYDKELFEIYQNYMKGGINVGASCRNILGFYHITIYPDQSGYIQYCSDFENPYMDMVFNRIKELYPEMKWKESKVHTQDSLKLALCSIEKAGEINENRRFRL